MALKVKSTPKQQARTSQPKPVTRPAASSKALVTQPKGDVPDYIRKDTSRGSENVETSDLVIPRLDVLQDLSPAVKPNDPNYIEGAQAGHLINSVTKELFDAEVNFIPVFFRKSYLVWKDRTSGGGFKGQYENAEQATAYIKSQPDAAQLSAVETAEHLILIVKDDGSLEEAMLSMSRTKLKVSRQLNSLVRMNGGDRFGRLYGLSSLQEKNAMGAFYNFLVRPLGFPSKEHYQYAEQVYDSIAQGKRKVRADMSDTAAGDTEDKGEY